MHLLYHMHRRLELLAVKPFRGCYHQYVFVHQDGDEQERFWCCAVSPRLKKKLPFGPNFVVVLGSQQA